MTDVIVNPMRHQSVFDPDKWGDRVVDVIGCGATGSRVIELLSKLGVRKIRAWDFDVFESHNIGNQAAGLPDIGQPKVKAVAARVLRDSGIQIEAREEKVTGAQKLGHTVFLLTDSMESRREIFSKGIKMKIGTKLLIETRMGVFDGRVYTIKPNDLKHIKAYEATLNSEAKPEVSACGTPISLGTTSTLVAAAAVQQFIRAFQIENGREDDLEHELMLGFGPFDVSSARFDK